MNIYKKLFEVQQELKAPKSLFNNFGGYSYRSTETILEAVKPLLNDQKAILLINDEIVEVGGKNYIKATAKLIDIETGESVENSALARKDEDRKKMDSPQITGSCSSYARKYCLNGMFAINDVKDSDTTNNGKEEQKALTKCNLKQNLNNQTDKVISFQEQQDLITKSEMMFIYSRGFQAGYSQDQVKNHIIKNFNKTIDKLTKKECMAIVEGYQAKILKKMEGEKRP